MAHVQQNRGQAFGSAHRGKVGMGKTPPRSTPEEGRSRGAAGPRPPVSALNCGCGSSWPAQAPDRRLQISREKPQPAFDGDKRKWIQQLPAYSEAEALIESAKRRQANKASRAVSRKLTTVAPRAATIGRRPFSEKIKKQQQKGEAVDAPGDRQAMQEPPLVPSSRSYTIGLD
ncbi:hypothetical protein HPB51_016878 [Rhipicephalus microplus]|uniref:Uncharacterized protein n=1 Tax=Rhipicephalus microplus TaxID=6941 RepID=A0A9J6DAI6_RHIMP|nr:hypothetical protein HPB51_016878 [Rhipicephalus microplus]